MFDGFCYEKMHSTQPNLPSSFPLLSFISLFSFLCSGACDLVLIHNPGFANGLGMDVHIRNKQYKSWSYIETAVLLIGGDTFEVMGGNINKYWVNGEIGPSNIKDGILPTQIAGYEIEFTQLSHGRRRFIIDLGNGEQFMFKTFKNFVRANIRAKSMSNFDTSVGLMGTYPSGEKVSRDGTKTYSKDEINDFGQEWQVMPSEPMLFHDMGDGPQAPQKCILPSISTQRRLAESTVSMEDAEIACATVADEDKDACIFDVLATSDTEMVGAY